MIRDIAMIPRSIALFLILYQFRLIAKDLTDSWVFIAIVIIGFAIAVFLSKKFTSAKETAVSLAVMAFSPWVIRFIVTIPRVLFSGTTEVALILDSLLFHIDRNYFVALIPFYWAIFTTFFAFRSTAFFRGEILVSDTLLAVFFSMAKTGDVYPLPIFMIGLFASIVFLQLIAFILSSYQELKMKTAERDAAILAIMVLIVLGGVSFLKPSQEAASRKSGGLLQPKIFKFDFSQILKLESEISMNDDLMFIVRKEGGGLLLRRYVMSGYKKAVGFFRTDADQETQPAVLPNSFTKFVSDFPTDTDKTDIVEQEYYMVNFDSQSFIAMNQPIEATPFENWDASSFNSAYAVKSLVSPLNDAYGDVETRIIPEGYGQEYGLSVEEYAFYTDFGKDQRIKAFAEEIIRNEESINEKIAAIYNKLKHGEYVYSLKPGIAQDGDQLAYFLFDSKKGYCSYYAFAFALLLRSIGIPCRVAAGFFVDPETNVFNYYPVRSDMAHAWVEVFFPSFGWVEFDPTSQTLALGEEFTFSQGVDPELFNRLMREILENHSRLKPKQIVDDTAQGRLMRLAVGAARLVKKYWSIVLIFAALCMIFLLRVRFLILSRLSRNPRKKAVFLWRHTSMRLHQKIAPHFAPDGFEHEWAKQDDAVYTLYRYAAAARFAPVYTMDDFLEMRSGYNELWKRRYSQNGHLKA
ncbi:MAG: transglutaminase-like domain-containing protein [Treponema sp.]|jgi:transglutaminase-like putative cysteine protease|nr:transglutaminase-like domain-containing protein [Treponema sp.]